MRMEAHISVVVGELSWMAHGRGSSRAISKSNSRKRIATRKNRIENGRRADPSGSNPHSYGDNFSESGFVCASQKFSVVRMILRIREEVIMNRIIFITLLWV